MNHKNPLIINGLDLAEKSDYQRKFSPFEKFYPRDFNEAQSLVLDRLNNIKDELNQENTSLKMLDDVYLEFSIPSDFLAKSYRIQSIFRKSNLDRVGSYKYVDSNKKEGKKEIIRGNKDNISNFKKLVENPTAKSEKEEIQRIEDVQLAKPEILIRNDEMFNTVELLFYSVSDDMKNKLLNDVFAILQTSKENLSYKWDDNNVLIVNVPFMSINLDELENMNYLRSAYNYGSSIAANQSTHQDSNIFFNENYDKNNLPYVGLIEGGVATDLKEFENVEEIYQVKELPSNQLVNHGSSIASILLYGELDKNNNNLTPQFNVISIRGLPSTKDDTFNLIDLENIIEKAVPNYPQVKVWNISIGPVGPITENFISSLTRLLDKLAYEHDVIFVIAGGNTGQQEGIAKRLQIPADSVNNLSVTAYYNHEDGMRVAPYASIGPGRSEAVLKPELIDHGGLYSTDPIYTLSNDKSIINEQAGTSFAAPLLSRKIARFNHENLDFSATEIKSLLINYLATNYNGMHSIENEGIGYIENMEDILYSNNENEFKIMYSGKLSAKSYIEVPIPLPDEYNSKSVEFTWTIATKTPVNPETPNEYTEYYIEDDFIPNIAKYTFRHPETNSQRVVDLSTQEGIEKAAILKKDGFKKTSYPNKTTDKYLYQKENQLKSEEMKWNTIKSQKITKYASSLNEPMLRLHGLSRNDSRERIEYCLVINVRLKDDINILENIQEKYKKLITIDEIRQESEAHLKSK